MVSNSRNLLQICLSPSWGGLEMVTYEFARDFHSAQLPIQTVCLEGSPLAERLKKNNLPCITMPAKGFFSRIRSLAKIIRKENPETIICQHLHDLWFLVPTVYFKKLRTIGLSHTFLGVSKKDFLHTFLYRRLDRMICMTGLHKKNLLENLNLPEEKFEVIPNMVDMNRFSPSNRSSFLYQKYNIPQNKLLVGVVGRLDEHKGQKEAIQAMEHLRQYSDRIHLLIVGEDTLNNPGTGKRLKNMVREKGLHEMVTFTGFMDHVEKAIASLDILLVPSSAETFGRTIIEGMASGVPVISTRAGGVPDIISDKQTGLLVEPQNSRDLAVAIEKLLLSPQMRTQLHEQALHQARRMYAKEVVEAQIKAIILAS